MVVFFLFLCNFAFAIEMTGVWTNEDGTKIIIPFLRDGDIPILFAEEEGPLIPVWGRWSIKQEHLQFSDYQQKTWKIQEGKNQESISVEKGEERILLVKKAEIKESNSSGIWIDNQGNEFIPIVAGNKIYVLHKNKQQITRVYRGRWQKEREERVLQFKAKRRCVVVFNSIDTSRAKANCGNSEEIWKRYYVPSEMAFFDLSGRWKAKDLTLKIELEGIKWKEAYLEHKNSITVYMPEWAGGIPGKKFYLRHPDFGMLVGVYHEQKPAKIILRMHDQDVAFYRTEAN